VSAETLSSILQIADRLFPFSGAEPWDNCGIQIGDPNRPIRAIAFSLDPTPETVKFASESSCELLITHHPVLLEPVRHIIPDGLSGKTLLPAAGARVDILSLHTNLDAAEGGLNDLLAARLGLEEVVTPLSASCSRIGRMKFPMRILHLAREISAALGIEGIRVVADGDPVVERVFVASGSGMSYLTEAVRLGADVMVTGDVRFHAAREALELGMPVIDAGHFGLEKAAPGLMAAAFRQEFLALNLDIACHECASEKDPFLTIPNLNG